MRDIPVFVTENGVASLFLKNVPVTKIAYIKIQDATNAQELLAECCEFCRTAGAEQLYAAGTDLANGGVIVERVVSMVRSAEDLPETEAQLVLVQEDTIELWRSIYNRKMKNVPNASQITSIEARNFLKSENCYFVCKDAVLLGIGMVDRNRVGALASVSNGAGRDVLLALCSVITANRIELSVAESNKKAITLYKSLGFSVDAVLETWWKIT